MDETLTLQSVSERLHVSPNYLGANLKKNAGTIRNLMTGRQTNISTRNLMTLARYFGMSMEEFIRKIQ